MIRAEAFDHRLYKSLNLNRFNRLVQQLFYIYKANSLPELTKCIQAQNLESVAKDSGTIAL